MRQYNDIKGKYPDALLLFRVGDFYETFGQDAITASKILDIILTNRANGSSKIELAGFPHHSLDNYLPKLVRAGYRVAICDQLEDPKKTKKIVKRGVTELVTPGVSYNHLTLDSKKNNFLASVYYGEDQLGVSFLDISTGEFLVSRGNVDYVNKLIQSFSPSEILFQRSLKKNFEEDFGYDNFCFPIDDWQYKFDYTNELLINQFETNSLKGFGINDLPEAIISAGVILYYLKETKHHQTSHILSISRINEEKYLWMDRFTIRNLELFYSPNKGAKTMIDIINQTETPMGSRLLTRWLALPLKKKKEIDERLDIVSFLKEDLDFRKIIKDNICSIGDLERLVSKASTKRINPKEVEKLKHSLISILPIKNACQDSGLSSLKLIGKQLNGCADLVLKIEKELFENPPSLLNKGNIINKGVHDELDELREIKRSGKEFLEKMLQEEIERTSISSLKISFNNVFGYYLEVRNTHKDKVPDNWIRKQTLVNAERYITQELKDYEIKILSAQEKIAIIEYDLYSKLMEAIALQVTSLQKNAQLISKLDCLLSFAKIADRYNYTRPNINDGTDIQITKGRHPVIEQQLESLNKYIPNSLHLNKLDQQIMMITGPNMSGKSAILRQTALIVLMAQIGSFVPAKEADIGLIDKIFTRVGASDNISMGESTFMVEMNETASILNNISDNSLILLDEIGRGTSTYDGVSIAWSIAEYIHNHSTQAKTLFATHYHELNDMKDQFSRIKNYNVSIKRKDKEILFMRTLQSGGSNHSFGIHVAKMAGMPAQVVNNAELLLKKLESYRKEGSTKDSEKLQLSFFDIEDPVMKKIKDVLVGIDINSLTPLEALMKLNEIKKTISD
ncbi:MAG: DNA mismatch repair protein MutS [Flavobacteriales bacterium]|nr:DNA mismatch repair protein MutS [Flavobacteriales bacterium]